MEQEFKNSDFIRLRQALCELLAKVEKLDALRETSNAVGPILQTDNPTEGATLDHATAQQEVDDVEARMLEAFRQLGQPLFVPFANPEAGWLTGRAGEATARLAQVFREAKEKEPDEVQMAQLQKEYKEWRKVVLESRSIAATTTTTAAAEADEEKEDEEEYGSEDEYESDDEDDDYASEYGDEEERRWT